MRSRRRTAAERYVHEATVLQGPGISEVAQCRAMGLSGWRGCLGTRLNPWPSSATIWTQQEGVLPSLGPHSGLSMGLGQEVSRAQSWSTEACLAPLASPAAHCKGSGPEESYCRAPGLSSIQHSGWDLSLHSHPGAWTQPPLRPPLLFYQKDF